MKILYAIFALFISSLASCFAINGLSIAVISTNAVLTWASTNDGETYLVQYRSNLTTTAWTTIADDLQASGSNTETFVDMTNIVTFGSARGTNAGGGGNPPNPGNTNSMSSGTNAVSFTSYTGFYQVVRDGAYGYFGDNTNWSGTEEIPVELGNSYGTPGPMELISPDGAPLGNSIQPAGTTLTVDTTVMTNGVNDVAISTSWEDTNGDYVESDSPYIAVNVYNEISFPDWMANYGELGNGAEFNFVCGHTNESWQLDVYGSDFAYIGSFDGETTTNGTVDITWNLVDQYNITHTNDAFFIGIVTSYFDSDSGEPGEEEAQAVTPVTYRLPDPWTGHGGFVIVQQHAWEDDNGAPELDAELAPFISAAQSYGYNVAPPPQDGNPYGLTFPAGSQGDTDWAKFRTALYDPTARNLCYFGHGGATGLGYNPGNTNRFISATEIGTMLNNIPAGQTNAHHFRFVFCDGCSTAKGNLCAAFGIPQKENVPDFDFVNAGLRLASFCGWTRDKQIGFLQGSGYVNFEHVNFITFIEQYLAQGQSIKQAMQSASESPGISSFGANSMEVYGSWDLTFQLDN